MSAAAAAAQSFVAPPAMAAGGSCLRRLFVLIPPACPWLPHLQLSFPRLRTQADLLSWRALCSTGACDVGLARCTPWQPPRATAPPCRRACMQPWPTPSIPRPSHPHAPMHPHALPPLRRACGTLHPFPCRRPLPHLWHLLHRCCLSARCRDASTQETRSLGLVANSSFSVSGVDEGGLFSVFGRYLSWQCGDEPGGWLLLRGCRCSNRPVGPRPLRRSKARSQLQHGRRNECGHRSETQLYCRPSPPPSPQAPTPRSCGLCMSPTCRAWSKAPRPSASLGASR